MTDLVDTTEMYLRTILDLEEEGIVPLRARISERLGHSGPTVSQTVGRMERDGLVVVSEDRRLELTDDGRQKAVDVMRKHRLAERLLSDVIGLDWAYVHDEACRWEHVMSEQVERRLVELLGHPTESPYGSPIPGLDQLGDAASSTFDDGTASGRFWAGDGSLVVRSPPRLSLGLGAEWRQFRIELDGWFHLGDDEYARAELDREVVLTDAGTTTSRTSEPLLIVESVEPVANVGVGVEVLVTRTLGSIHRPTAPSASARPSRNSRFCPGP